jgi:hypothetical protein
MAEPAQFSNLRRQWRDWRIQFVAPCEGIKPEDRVEDAGSFNINKQISCHIKKFKLFNFLIKLEVPSSLIYVTPGVFLWIEKYFLL